MISDRNPTVVNMFSETKYLLSLFQGEFDFTRWVQIKLTSLNCRSTPPVLREFQLGMFIYWHFCQLWFKDIALSRQFLGPEALSMPDYLSCLYAYEFTEFLASRTFESVHAKNCAGPVELSLAIYEDHRRSTVAHQVGPGPLANLWEMLLKDNQAGMTNLISSVV